MDSRATIPLLIYQATVEFRSAGEPFAIERFTIEARDACDADPLVRARAEASTYANERIPDLDFAIALTLARVPQWRRTCFGRAAQMKV